MKHDSNKHSHIQLWNIFLNMINMRVHIHKHKHTYIHTYAQTYAHTFTHSYIYEGCPESIQPFWISRELVVWPWCNLAASQRRPHCASVNIHSPVGLVSRKWNAVDRACVLCDRHIRSDRASRSASSWRCTRPFYSAHCLLTSPTVEWLFIYAQYGLLWLAARLHQGHMTGSRDIQNGWTFSGQPSYTYAGTVNSTDPKFSPGDNKLRNKS